MPDETLADLMRSVGIREDRPRAPRAAVWDVMNAPRPPLPRTRADLQAAQDNQFAQQRLAQQREAFNPGIDRSLQRDHWPGRPSVAAEAGQMMLENTGLPSMQRSGEAFRSGEPLRGAGELGMGLLGVAGTAGGLMSMAPARALPPRPPAPVRAYRGLRAPYESGADNVATYEYWTANPRLASQYATEELPGATAPNVVPGDINTRNFLSVDAGGAAWDNIPIAGIGDRTIRGRFPNQNSSRGVTSRQLTQYAEDAGYDGVTFNNMRDAPFSATDPDIAGPNTIYGVINRNARRGQFGPLDATPPARPASVPDGGGAGGSNLPTWDRAPSPIDAGLLSRHQNGIYKDLDYHGSYRVEELPLSAIIRQHQIDPARTTGAWYRGLGQNRPRSTLPSVALVDGRYILMDGHHRLASEVGDTARVRVYDIDQFTNPPHGSRAVQNTETGEWSLEPNPPNGGPLPDPNAVTRLPVNPSREIGPNGLPIREREPFRNSLRGGSDDLREAAGMGGGQATRRVYHVSPFEFDQPNLNNAYQGEGSQIMGRGFYTAEAPAVRDAYSTGFERQGRQPFVYEVDIPDGPYIDLDAPFAQQPPQVQELLRTRGLAPDSPRRSTALIDAIRERGGLRNAERELTGRDYYDMLGIDEGYKRGIGFEEQASRRLSELGIHGARYRDRGSRNAASSAPTFNYVVFDPERTARVISRTGVKPPDAPKQNTPRKPPPGGFFNFGAR